MKVGPADEDSKRNAPPTGKRTRKRDEIVFQAGHFRAIIESLPVALYLTDASGRITYFNRAAADLWGREPRLGQDFWCGALRLFRPDGTPLPHEECPMAQTLRSGLPTLGEIAIAERPDGTRISFVPYPSPLFDSARRLMGAVNMLFDVSGWEANEQATLHLASIVESSDDAIVSKDTNGIIRSWNGAAERLFGYEAGEIVGKSILTIIPAERQQEETAIIERIRAGLKVEHFETVRRRKDGSLVDVAVTVSPIRDASGRVVGASKIARDITERRRSERIRELLVSEIKHRVKNTLSTVQALGVQTFRSASPGEREAFVARLHALGGAHDVLTQREWGEVALEEIVARALEPFRDTYRDRIASTVADVRIGANRALLVAMVVHELGTNAVKYGALSNAAGTVELTASAMAKGQGIEMVWRERGGPPVQPPSEKGFGSRMIERAIRGERGLAEFDFAPSGLCCRIKLPF